MSNFLRSLLFDFALECWPGIYDKLREGTASITPETFRRMIKEGSFPVGDASWFAKGHEFLEELKETLTPERIMEILAEARPDLTQVLLEFDVEGYQYIVNLRAHLLDLVRHPEKALPAPTPKKDMVKATCEACGKTWFLSRVEAEKLAECPFCHKGKEDSSH